MVKQCRFDGDLKLLLTFQGAVRFFRNSNQKETAVKKRVHHWGETSGSRKEAQNKEEGMFGKLFYLRLREMVFCWLMGVP